jgi:hypothetical protein
LFGLVEMVVFIGLVFVAYLYIWQKGGLEWEGPEQRRLPAAAVGGLPAWVERGPGDRPARAPTDESPQPAATSEVGRT